jgi:hypothetical protein
MPEPIIYNRKLYTMKPQGSSIHKPGSKYSPAPIIYNRESFKMGATDPDKHIVEMQRSSENQCWPIYSTNLPHSKTVRTLCFYCWAYQGLLRGHLGKEQNTGNIIRQAIMAGIPNPRLLSLDQCLDGIEACSWKLKGPQTHAHGQMNVEIQRVTEQHFDLSMSLAITMTSLQEKIGFLLDTEFATNLLNGNVEIPDNVDNVVTMVLREIICLFRTLQSDYQEISLGDKQFQYYWRKLKEKTSSSIVQIHMGHYISATYSNLIDLLNNQGIDG